MPDTLKSTSVGTEKARFTKANYYSNLNMRHEELTSDSQSHMLGKPSITKCPLGRKSIHNLDRCSYSSFIFVLNCHEHSSFLNFPQSYLGQRQRPVHRSIVHHRRDTVMLRFNPVGKYKSHICLEMSKDEGGISHRKTQLSAKVQHKPPNHHLCLYEHHRESIILTTVYSPPLSKPKIQGLALISLLDIP